MSVLVSAVPRRRRVGVIELLAYTVASEWERLVGVAGLKRQFYALMPQVVAAWCRRGGHRVSYATYYGQAAPEALLPDDIDIVFIAATTQASALAYALARFYRARGVTTVLGGPHAKAFPDDSARFFDVTVKDCDAALLGEVLAGVFDPGAIVASAAPPASLPSVEERLPDISVAAFHRGRPTARSVISLWSSIGCPYDCGFCTDWNARYVRVPTEQLQADLDFVAARFPGTTLGFHDPNFGVRMDDALDCLERVPAARRSPFLMQCSLAVITPARLARLGAARCLYLAPGVESWSAFGAKLGARGVTGPERVARLVDSFGALHRHVAGLQANFVMGLDEDAGGEPFDLTAAFIDRTPFVWPNINILTPYGGTPMHARIAGEGRLLAAMPLALYCAPYLAFVPRHYAALDLYERMVWLSEHALSLPMSLRRMVAGGGVALRLARFGQIVAFRRDLTEMRGIRDALRSDGGLRRFHEGRSADVPPMYLAQLRRRLGHLQALLSDDDLRPVQAVAVGRGEVQRVEATA